VAKKTIRVTKKGIVESNERGILADEVEFLIGPDVQTDSVTEEKHKTIRQLIHFISMGPAEGFASGAFLETTYQGVMPVTSTWYESNAKLKKIVECNAVYSGFLITQEIWKMYDTDGSTVSATVVDDIIYNGLSEINRTRTVS
jgi:hypothetical protein